MRLSLFLSMSILLFMSCQKKVTFADTSLTESYDQFNSNQSEETAKNFAGKVVEYLLLNPDGEDRQKALETGMKVSDQFNLTAAKSSFLTTTIKEFPRDAKTPDRVFELASLMKSLGKTEANNALIYSFLEKYKDHPKADEAKKMLSSEISDIDQYVTDLGNKVFENPDDFGINQNSAQAYVDACEAYAMVNPESVVAPDFLYKAAEIARTLRTFPKALSLYDWIIDSYPEYEKSPTSLFLKAYVLENNLNDIDRARTSYEAFLSKYPNHHLSDDVNFLLENLGKSDDEILEIITKKKEGQEQ